MNNRVSWDDFRKSGMLWFVNRILMCFNLVIVLAYDSDTEAFIEARVERTANSGFTEEVDEATREDFRKIFEAK